MPKVEINMFPASYGDSFLVRCLGEKNTNFLIDMGFKSTYTNSIKSELESLNSYGEKIDLLVFTHIDRDHIQGGLKFFEENGVKDDYRIIDIVEIWHNSYKHLQFDKVEAKEVKSKLSKENSNILERIIKKGYGREAGVREVTDIGYEQGSTLASLVYENKFEKVWNKSFDNKAVMVDISKKLEPITINHSVNITLLSPTIHQLKKLDNGWKSKLIELGYSEKIYSNEIMDDAFEVYNANLREKKKISREIFKISGEEIGIEEIACRSHEEDTSPINGSSISFILEYQGAKILFLGDSHPSVITENLKYLISKSKEQKLFFDAVKLSHHGSKSNTSLKLLELFEADKYIFSTNGRGTGFTHPDIETIYRIITSKTKNTKELIFNYKPNHIYERINNQCFKDKYNFTICYKNEFSKSKSEEITRINIK
ncbi:MAG: MBL fold metallo-hydrolase [Bacillota bacterium]